MGKIKHSEECKCMKSYTVLMNEICLHVSTRNLLGVIETIKSALEPASQKQQLKWALSIIGEDATADTILDYTFRARSKELREILIINELIPPEFYTKKNSDGYSPLAVAVSYGDYEYVEMCLKNGANPNELCGKERLDSLLMVASSHCNSKMVKLLINYGANVASYGAASIFRAIKDCQFIKHRSINLIGTVELLIHHGANVLQKIFKDDNCNLLEWAISYTRMNNNGNPDNQSVIALLEKETHDQQQLNYNIRLMFWASRNDAGSSLSVLPEDIIKKIASIACNKM